MLEPEGYAVCKQYGIRVPPFKMVDSLEGALAAAREIGYPVVIKVVSEKILHKSDIGGVMLSIVSDSGAGNFLCEARRQRPQGGAWN